MSDSSDERLELLRKIHGLLELLAKDKIAQRDAKQRARLREIVGSSLPKQKSVYLMDGTRTQADIQRSASVNQGHLSTMVSKLQQDNLLQGDLKRPNLAISIPKTFFETDAE